MKVSQETIDECRRRLDSGKYRRTSASISKDGVTWKHVDIWIDQRNETVAGHVLSDDGQTYTIEVETLSTASITVRAKSPEQALEWARGQAAPNGLMDDEPLEYDWPTAKVREH